MKMDKNIDKCYGCNMKIDNTLYTGCLGGKLSIYNDIICPCSKCLLKGVCSDPCEKYNEYMSCDNGSNICKREISSLMKLIYDIS